MQTTYENFRYRYDKKENPYNGSVWENFKAIFFSKIKPSLNNFREFALVDEPPSMQPTPTHLLEATGSPKAKIDIEMGSSIESDHSLPSILRNLDYDYVEDSLKSKEGGEGVVGDPIPVEEESGDYKPNSALERECYQADFSSREVHIYL